MKKWKKTHTIKGLEPVKEKELLNINGGNPIIIGIAVAGFFYLLSEYDDLKQGFNDGLNGSKYNYKP